MAGNVADTDTRQMADRSSFATYDQDQLDDTLLRMRSIASKIVRFGALAGLYALLIVCLSAVMILAAFLGIREDANPSTAAYPHAYNILLHGIGTVFMTFLFIKLRCKKRRIKKEEKLAEETDTKVQRSGAGNSAFEQGSITIPTETMSGSLNIAMKGLTMDELRERFIQRDEVTFDSEGISFFSQMGLLGFGLGASLLDGARLMQYTNNPGVWDCYGRWYFASSWVNIGYLWLMMFFILKFHTAVINFNRAIIKFGLAHLIATNIGTWITTVVIEGTSFEFLNNETTNNTQDYGKIKMLGCIREYTIHDVASPYLYPFTIEFSLLAAANLYRIYSNVGGIIVHDRKRQVEEKVHTKEKSSIDCHKAHTGLFYGFIILLGIVCASVLYIYYDTNSENESVPGHPGLPITHFAYMVTAICANVIGIITLFPTSWKLRTLHFNGELDCALDVYLLVMGVLGYYMLFGLIGMAGIYKLNGHGPEGTMAKLVVTLCALEYFQTTSLVITLIDGLHRRAGTSENEEEKPGRSLVTFHIVLNMGLWIVNTFLLKGFHHLELFNEFYGHEAWGLLVRVFLPLSIFFRFHAAVCFADIWQNGYKMEKSSTLKFLDVAQRFEETMF